MWSAAYGLSLIAIATSDCAYRRVSNALACTVAVAALLFACVHGGSAGFVGALAGGLAGGGLILLLYLVGYIGAGDVKAAVALGAWAGDAWTAVLGTFWGLILGGVLGAAVLMRQPNSAPMRVLSALQETRRGQALLRARAANETLPLAAALAMGLWLVRVGRNV